MKKFDGVFSSEKMEKDYREQQLEGILKLFQIFQVLQLLVYVFVFITSIAAQDYTTPGLMIFCCLVALGQLIYFKRNPSYKALTSINISNIVFALLDFQGVVQQEQGVKFNVTDEFFWGAGFFVIHQGLLVNPLPSSDVIIMILCYLIHIGVKSINHDGFPYFALIMVPCVGFFLSRLNIEHMMKRKLFVLEKEKFQWENIIRVLIDYPYLILKYDLDGLKFHLVETNSPAQIKLKINDTNSMRQALREMICHKNRKTVNFESHLLQLIKNMETQDVNGENQHKFQLDKIKYITQVFMMNAETKTFLITFKNFNQSLFNQTSKQTIVNQQIAFCNLASKQLEFAKLMKQSMFRQDRAIYNIDIKRNILEIYNQLAILKIDPLIKITSFELQKQIVKICQLFPKIVFYLSVGHDFCKSEILIFQSMIFNIFQLSQHCQKIHIDVKVNEDNFDFIILIHPLKEYTFHLLQKTNEADTTFTHLNKIQQQHKFNFLMFKKNLQILSPQQKIELQYKYHESLLTISFKIYRDLYLINQ